MTPLLFIHGGVFSPQSLFTTDPHRGEVGGEFLLLGPFRPMLGVPNTPVACGWLKTPSPVVGVSLLVGLIMANNSKNLAIVYDDVRILVSTLATKTAILGASKIDASREMGFRIMKTEYVVGWNNTTAGDGPLVLGFAANLNQAEIEEAIEGDPQSSVDTEDAETIRPVWVLGMLAGSAAHGNLDGGRVHSFTPKWSIPEGSAGQWFVYNIDSASMTDGTVVSIFAKHYGVWLRD